MKAINDTLQPLLESIRERFGNPFVGSFLIAWCVINFRVVLILLGGDTAQQKICFVERELIEADDGLWKAVIWPTISVLFYFLIIKPISAGFVFLHEYFEALNASSRNKALKMKVLTVEDQARLYAELHDSVEAEKEKNLKASAIAVRHFQERDQIISAMHSRITSVMLKALPALMEEWKEDRVNFDVTGVWWINVPTRKIGYGHGVPESWLRFVSQMADRAKEDGYPGWFNLSMARDLVNGLPGNEDVQVMLDSLVALDLLKFVWDGDEPAYSINKENVSVVLEQYSRFVRERKANTPARSP